MRASTFGDAMNWPRATGVVSCRATRVAFIGAFIHALIATGRRRFLWDDYTTTLTIDARGDCAGRRVQRVAEMAPRIRRVPQRMFLSFFLHVCLRQW